MDDAGEWTELDLMCQCASKRTLRAMHKDLADRAHEGTYGMMARVRRHMTASEQQKALEYIAATHRE